MRIWLWLGAAAIVACGNSNANHLADGHVDGAIDHGDSGSNDSGATTVTVTFTNAPTVPADFAFVVGFEDGSGAWQTAPAPTGGVYTLSIASASYGVVYTCIGNGGGSGSAIGLDRDVVMGNFAVAENPALALTVPARCTDTTPALAPVAGSFANQPATGSIAMFLAGKQFTVVPNAAGLPGYATNVLPGTYDLVAVHSPPPTAGVTVPDLVLVQRGLAVGSAGVAGNALDFSKAKAVQDFNLNVSLGSGAQIATSTDLVASSTTATLVTETAAGGKPQTLDAIGLSASQALATDLYAIRVAASAGSGNVVQAASFVTIPTADTFVAPPVVGAVLSTVPTTAPYPELALSWSAYANATGYEAVAKQGCAVGNAPTVCLTWTMAMSATVAGASPALQMPDLTSLAGWDTRLQLVTGAPVAGEVAAETSTAGTADFPLSGLPPAGTKRTTATTTFSVTP
jgi:hypothetical protein|nr:hypothetical protein [Kofleriaceae bacterium]